MPTINTPEGMKQFLDTIKALHTRDPDPSVIATPETAGPVGSLGLASGSGLQEYQPELWTIRKDDIYAAIYAVENGLEYARECLMTHESNLGRTTLKNKLRAERMEDDMRHMERLLANLRLYSAHTIPGPNTTMSQPGGQS